MWGNKGLAKLKGAIIQRIYMNEDYLRFETDIGPVVFGVSGDCCSQSVFYDFYGVKKLFGKRVKDIEEVALEPSDIVLKKDKYGYEEQTDKKSYQESISVYGYRITVEDKSLGDVSAVFSFRNYSNGYYGGSLDDADDGVKVLPEVFEDVIETVLAPSFWLS